MKDFETVNVNSLPVESIKSHSDRQKKELTVDDSDQLESPAHNEGETWP